MTDIETKPTPEPPEEASAAAPQAQDDAAPVPAAVQDDAAPAPALAQDGAAPVPAPAQDDAAAAVVLDEESEEKEKDFEFVEDPVFEVDYKGDCAYEVKIIVPAANEQKLANEVFDELKHEVEVPGFRRGRAPRKLIERKFAKIVRNDVAGRLMQAAFKKLLKDKDLHPMAPPDVEDLEKPAERQPGDPVTFTLKFEVQPRVELGKYRGVAVERPVCRVEDKDIDEALKAIQTRHAVFESVADGVAEEGDHVIISFRGTIEGEEFPGGKAENYPYVLGSKRFFPEFEDVLRGRKPGDTVSCEVHFPDSYPVEHLRGRTAVFEIKVNEIKRRNIPEFTEEFARQANYESVQDAREKIVARLRERAAAESNEIAESRVLKTIIDSSTFEIPKSLIDTMAQEFHKETVKDMRTRHVPMSHIEENEAALRAEARKEAIEAIKSWTTLNEIAEAEGIEVTDEDFQKEAAELSQRTGASLETVASFLGEEEHRNRYERRILHAKVTQAVMGLVAITDKEVSREELEHADEQPAEGGASCQELEHADEQLAEGGASCQELEHADEQPAQGEAS